ncbi:hypothetical protein [Citricoccus sp. GCM10030269]|uniref:hypothetical protein n=1 Tax=Citricoccus sp. GCM10030269 TaxID=3273388 RepID=UPI00361F6AA5
MPSSPERPPAEPAWKRWLPGQSRRRRERRTEEFIVLLRRASALLQAGRRPDQIWSELSALYEPCARAGTPRGCCLNHELVAADVEVVLGGDPLAHTNGPGQRRHWQQLSGCLAVSRDAGVGLVGLLDRLADALEEGQDAQQARDAAIAGPQSTARLLGLLPLAGLGLSALAGAPPTELLSNTLGWLVVGTGGGLAVVGQLWTRALIRQSEDLS